jgi:hypothetical protein
MFSTYSPVEGVVVDGAMISFLAKIPYTRMMVPIIKRYWLLIDAISHISTSGARITATRIPTDMIVLNFSG